MSELIEPQESRMEQDLGSEGDAEPGEAGSPDRAPLEERALRDPPAAAPSGAQAPGGDSAVIAVDPPPAVEAALEAADGPQAAIESPDGPGGGTPAEATAAGAAWEDIATALGDLGARIEESQGLLARQVELADRLHAENQRLRSGELRAALSPLVRDLLRLHDDIGRLLEVTEEAAQTDLTVVRESLLDALARNGALSFAPEPGVPFDPKLHGAVGVVATEQAEADRTVAETLRVGFRWEDAQMIRVADVRVFKYRAPEDVGDEQALTDSRQPTEIESNGD